MLILNTVIKKDYIKINENENGEKKKKDEKTNIEYFTVFPDCVKYMLITQSVLTCFTASFPILPVRLVFLPSQDSAAGPCFSLALPILSH